MKKLEDIAFVIQARLGSQRVPQKMIKDFCGTNLLDISLAKITSSRVPTSQFFVSAYEEELKEVGRKHGLNVLGT